MFDLIEPFRILGDRTAVLLFTGRRAQKDFFEPVPGGVALNKEGRAAFLVANLNERLDRAVRYPVQGKPGKTRNIKRARHDPVRGARPGQPPAGPAGHTAHGRDAEACGTRRTRPRARTPSNSTSRRE